MAPTMSRPRAHDNLVRVKKPAHLLNAGCDSETVSETEGKRSRDRDGSGGRWGPRRRYAHAMPPLSRVRRRVARSAPAARPRILVVGDLVLDVVMAADRDLERGTDITGHVQLRQGGSAASTARWLGRLGAKASLVCAVGRDAVGRALVAVLTADGVQVRAVRVAGARTGRIGVFVETGGERSFVTDRGAALRLRPEDLRPDWFVGVEAVHLPAYSLLEQPLGRAGMVAIRLARDAGALVSVDLSSSAPLLAKGRRAARALIREAAPDLLFATRDEARALVGAKNDVGLLDLAPVAVVKRGRKGATVLSRDGTDTLRFEIATTPIRTMDTTGAGDAFDAGFLAAWLDARRRGLAPSAALQRGAVAGNRTALRHLSSPPAEISLS
jgi:sugar/nucleoside kinase (ribokinase family)